jgi:His-Xaa-Ser system protein HxsD
MTAANEYPDIRADGSICFRAQVNVYPLEAVKRAAHEFTDRAYVFIASEAETSVVTLRPKLESEDPQKLAGDFCNSLLDHALRIEIGSATRQIRDLLVAQAFVEADLLDRRDSDSSLESDPRGLTARR